MLKIAYTPSFIRQHKKLESTLQDEILEKIDFLRDENSHQLLKVHKLHGILSGRYSFSVNYRIRIIFKYLSKQEVVLLSVGDHDVYDK